MIPEATLIDPRPHGDLNRYAWHNMPMMPISYDCDWMKYNELFAKLAVVALAACLDGEK